MLRMITGCEEGINMARMENQSLHSAVPFSTPWLSLPAKPQGVSPRAQLSATDPCRTSTGTSGTPLGACIGQYNYWNDIWSMSWIKWRSKACRYLWEEHSRNRKQQVQKPYNVNFRPCRVAWTKSWRRDRDLAGVGEGWEQPCKPQQGCDVYSKQNGQPLEDSE